MCRPYCKYRSISSWSIESTIGDRVKTVLPTCKWPPGLPCSLVMRHGLQTSVWSYMLKTKFELGSREKNPGYQGIWLSAWACTLGGPSTQDVLPTSTYILDRFRKISYHRTNCRIPWRSFLPWFSKSSTLVRIELWYQRIVLRKA